ncbi:MAG: hypothetical protein PHG05_01840 [Candidatus Nanoarchaeia archaeon]|nr:hypothetical protein [Candidatus Nanoarchaeia archaeon]
MRERRGALEGGAAVAAFVLLLALFIIVYVILLPAEQRDELLKYDTGTIPSDSTETTQTELNKVSLLAVSPGRVYKFDEDTIKKEFNNIAIYSKITEELIDLRDKIYFSRTLFSNTPETVYFRLENAEVADKVDLYFFLAKGSGDILIELNGQKVFDGKIITQELPIELPKNYLKKDNTLKFIVKSAIFKKEFELSDLYLKYGFMEENKKVKRTFVMTSSEEKGIKKAELKYYLNCVNLGEGLLIINLNNNQIYKGKVLCDTAGETVLDIEKDFLKEDTNVLEFNIDKGDFILEDVVLELEVSEASEEEYTFFIEDDDYDYIDVPDYDLCIDECKDSYTKGTTDYTDCVADCDSEYEVKNVILRMKFDNKIDSKKAKIFINDIYFNMDTKDEIFKKDISDYVQRGANYIKIEPRNDFTIGSLNIYLEEK